MAKGIPNKENQNVKTNPSTTSSTMAPGGKKKKQKKRKDINPIGENISQNLQRF